MTKKRKVKPVTGYPLEGWIISHPRFEADAYTPVYHKREYAVSAARSWAAVFKNPTPKVVRIAPARRASKRGKK